MRVKLERKVQDLSQVYLEREREEELLGPQVVQVVTLILYEVPRHMTSEAATVVTPVYLTTHLGPT